MRQTDIKEEKGRGKKERKEERKKGGKKEGREGGGEGGRKEGRMYGWKVRMDEFSTSVNEQIE